jgi:hypothetical protein
MRSGIFGQSSPVQGLHISSSRGIRRLVWQSVVCSNIPVMSRKFLTTTSHKNILGHVTYRNPFKLATLRSHDLSSSASQTYAASGIATYGIHGFLLSLLGRCSLTLRRYLGVWKDHGVVSDVHFEAQPVCLLLVIVAFS